MSSCAAGCSLGTCCCTRWETAAGWSGIKWCACCSTCWSFWRTTSCATSTRRKAGLYARVEHDFPELAPLVLELRAEHDSIRRSIQECSDALGQGEASERGALSILGGSLARDLRDHLRREEEELIPTAVERWLERCAS